MSREEIHLCQLSIFFYSLYEKFQNYHELENRCPLFAFFNIE